MIGNQQPVTNYKNMKNKNYIKSFFFALLLLFAFTTVNAQTQKRFIDIHRETPNNPYKAPSPDRETTPGYRSVNNMYFTVQVNVDSDGNNIEHDAANEPSIAIDPTNPDNMVIGWRQFDNISSDFRQAGYAYSTDGGHHWTFPGVIDPGVFRSDPVLGFDANGKFYYNSLTADQYNNFLCRVFRSENGGQTWDNGVDAKGGDKQWMIIDRTGEIGNGNIYSDWTSYYSSCYPGYFTRSTDGGDSYESCVTIGGNPHWGTLAVGSDGALYAGGVNDGGNFVFSKSITAKDPSQPVTWQFNTIVDLGGYMQNADGPNPAGLKGQVWISADTSNGPNSGNIYMLCSVKPQNSSDPCDVMFARSTDGGEIWDVPVRINDDPVNSPNWQWFGTMSVAPNGRIDVVWLDTRDNPGTYLSSLYYSYSLNGGETWSINQRISDEFNPHTGWPQQQKMGDYFHMVSLVDGAYLAWSNTLNGEQDVYFTKIYSGFDNVAENSVPDKSSIFNYPNPFGNKTTIHYTINKKSRVKIVVTDMFGKIITTLVDGEKNAGNHTLTWLTEDLPEGMYICKLSMGKSFSQTKLICIK